LTYHQRLGIHDGTQQRVEGSRVLVRPLALAAFKLQPEPVEGRIQPRDVGRRQHVVATVLAEREDHARAPCRRV